MVIVSTVVAFAVWLASRVIDVDTGITGELRAKVVEIANKCPVHLTLESSAIVVTSADTRSEAAPPAVPEPGPDGEIPQRRPWPPLRARLLASRGEAVAHHQAPPVNPGLLASTGDMTVPSLSRVPY